MFETNTMVGILEKIGTIAIIIVIIIIALTILLMFIGSKSAAKEAVGSTWQDSMRIGPFTFSWHKYMIKGERLIERKGVWRIQENEVYLYLITDLTVQRNVIQRIFGIGTIILSTRDENDKKIYLRVKDPKKISDELSETVLRYRRQRRELIVR